MRRLALAAATPLFLLIVLSAPTKARADLLGSIADPFEQALNEGSFGLALGLIFLAGLVTALTPCVYPMIAITVSVFGARETKTRTEGALLSTAFVLGIAALFTPLGLISALTGTAMGSALANPWVLGVLGLLFLAMAASMFGAFDLSLPAGLQNRLAQVGGKGYRGAFLVGFVSGLIAAPCTGPVITVLLAWVGTSKDAGFGALSLFVYSLGLGVLFWIVGTFAISLPKSGRWLEWVKSLFGVIMLALALYYLRALLPLEMPAQRTIPLLVGGLGALLLGLLGGAIHLSFKYTSRVEKIRKGVSVALAVGGILASIGWLEALPEGEQIAWRDDYEAAKSEALSSNRPLLVDFGADWCNACRELEHQALSDPRVVAESRRFVCARVDLSADRATPETWALLQEVYQQPGLPFVVMHDGEGDVVERITGLVSAEEFLRRMRAID